MTSYFIRIVYSIRHPIRDNHNRNVFDLALISRTKKSSINMPIKGTYMISYMMEIVMFALSVIGESDANDKHHQFTCPQKYTLKEKICQRDLADCTI